MKQPKSIKEVEKIPGEIQYDEEIDTALNFRGGITAKFSEKVSMDQKASKPEAQRQALTS